MTSFGIEVEIVLACVLVFVLTLVVLTALHFVFGSVFSLVSRVTGVMVKAVEYMAVPLAAFAGYCLQMVAVDGQGAVKMVLGSLCIVLIPCVLVIVMVLVKF